MVKLREMALSGLVLLGFTGIAQAQDSDDCRFYTYKAEVTGVYDGDTITADIDLGFHVWLRGEKLRLYGIDAPEIKARANRPVNAAEKARGLAARDALRNLILGKEVVLCTIKGKQGKFGRYLARIEIEGLDVNIWLVTNGYAEPYALKGGVTSKN